MLDSWFGYDLNIGQSAIAAFALTVIMDIWHWTPLVTLTLLAALVSLPKEPFEQAQIDGANKRQIFWHITLPMIRPAILATVFIRLMDALRTVDEVLDADRRRPGRGDALSSACTSGRWSSPRPTTAMARPSRSSCSTSPGHGAGCSTSASSRRATARRTEPMQRRRPWLTVLLWMLLSLLTLFPIYWLFVISVKPAVELFTTPERDPRTFYWKNYVKVLATRRCAAT